MNIFICPKTVVERFATRLMVPLCFLLFTSAAFAGNQFVRINEVMAGLNGDSAVQFVELFVPDETQKQWGPQSSELVGRVMLVFFDGAGNPTGRYVFASDPAPGALSVLVATQEFADLTGITPDFIMPKGVMPIAGKVSFRNNPDAGAAGSSINLCLSYGGTAFTGNTEGAGPANGAKLSILDSQSLRRTQNFGAASFGSSGQLNADFALGTPTPSSTRASGNAASIEHNLLGEAVLPVADTPVNQGKILFLRETFLGNGRTCATCHIPAERFSLPPSRVAILPASDTLFLTEQNVNRLVINSLGSVNPSASSGTTQPSDFPISGIITGSLGGSATVLAGSGNTYFIVGGSSLNIPGNVISDLKGNRGTLVSFTSGNLNGPTPTNADANGLENTTLLRGTRALILENINGFSQNGFMRGSPSLMNVKFTAPYGLSGEFADLQSFAANAVRQHFARSLTRVPGVDFRVPTTEELDTLAAFQNSLTLPANENFDETNGFDRFLTTSTQRQGRDRFLGSSCSVCHGGKTLSQSDGRFGTIAGVNESFDTGVIRRAINVADRLPTEQGVGQPPNTRRFNVPSLIGLRRTAPFFHESSAIGLDEAILFYDSSDFSNSPAAAQIGGPIVFGNTTDIAEFLQAVGEEPFGAPTITGTGLQPDVNDNAALSPFRGTIIGDPDTPAQQLTVTVSLDSAAKGRFSSLNGFAATAGGQMTFLGTAAAATAAIRGLVFQPREGRLPVNATEMVRFALSVNDGLITPTIDDATVVNVKAAGGAPSLSAIPTQVVPINNPTPPIPFSVFGLDTSSPGFNLTAHSSDQTVVADTRMSFSGGGGDRALTITPTTGARGVLTVTVTASDAGKSATTSFVLVVGQTPMNGLVVPPRFAGVEGNSFSGAFVAPMRLQAVYGAVNFPPGLMLINTLSFRPNAGSGAVTGTIPSLEIRMSTTSRAPDALSTVLANNTGTNEVVVFNGPFNLAISGTAAGPGPFDITIPLSTPFLYDTRTGNLLLDIQNFSSGPIFFEDGSSDPDDAASRLVAANGLSGGVDSDADIIRLDGFFLNRAPTISDIPDQTTLTGNTVGPLSFTIDDAETAPNSLSLAASSSNPAVIPAGAVVFGGSGQNRTVSFTSLTGQTGVVALTITVSDGQFTASDILTATVGPLPPTISDIPDQTISLTGTSPAIAFTVGDLDTALNNLTLSATSSNPSLLPAGNVAFSGVGATRTLTLTPIGLNAGQAIVTVTISDGALTANDTFVVTAERVLVLPPGNDSTPGNSASGTLIAPIRLQNLYHASLFPASPILITRLSFRANEAGTPPISAQIPRLQISLSSTPTAPDTLSTSFTANAGADNTLVFDGPLTINSAGAAGPNAGPFDISIPLTIPFIYNPSSGNLLIDIQNFSTGPSFFVDSASSAGDLSSRLWSTSPTAGQFVDSVADVIKFEYDFASGPFPPVISAIPDQTWAAGGTPHTLNFAVTDFDTALNNLALSVTSSNPALIPGSNGIFGGSGANRTLTLTPIASAQGQTTITVTVSDGALSATEAFVVTVANKLVVPVGLEFVEGNSASGTLIAPIRLQNLYHASLFPTVPIRITHVSFRAEQGVGPFSSQIPNLQINMSTTSTAPDGLSTSFAANHGADNTQVFNGPLAINTAGALAGPGAFDITIPLSTPFLYVPSSGNLLVDVQNFSSGPSFFVDNVFNPNDLSSRVWNTSASFGQFVDTHADVIEFTYQPGNLSPTISSLPDRTTVEDVATPSINFSIGDVETPISLLTLAGTSSNHSLVPDANLAFAGSGPNRSVVITPSLNRSGTTTITLSVADGGGATASSSFLLTVLADADGDLVPDDFEVANGMDRLDPADAAQDLDGDGFSNLEEFLLGTDPRVASGSFEIANTQPNGADFQITFNSVVGKNYRFERSDISPAGPWTAISDVVGNGGALQITDAGGAAQPMRFYHILLLP